MAMKNRNQKMRYFRDIFDIPPARSRRFWDLAKAVESHPRGQREPSDRNSRSDGANQDSLRDLALSCFEQRFQRIGEWNPKRKGNQLMRLKKRITPSKPGFKLVFSRPNEKILAPRKSEAFGIRSNPMKYVIVTQWVRTRAIGFKSHLTKA